MSQRSTMTGKGKSRTAVSPAAVLNQLDVAILVIDRDGQILYRNPASQHLLSPGNDLDAVLRIAKCYPPITWQHYLAGTFSEKQPASWSAPLIADSNHHLLIRSMAFPHGQKDLALLCIEKKKCEALLEEDEVARRLASLGRLAARVAHELNNPLDGILRYVNLALRVAGEVPATQLSSYLSESRTGLLRMIRIVADLLEFSRNSDAGFEETSINELIEQAVRTCSGAADHNRVVISADFQADSMPKVRGFRLYQVCCNLIRNAIDVMPDGGRLTVTSGLIGDDVLVRIADTGNGLPQPVEKVFEPFYTTKPSGKGTGLGLAICKELVEGMQGTITAANLATGGAVFTVRVPVRALTASSTNAGVTPC